jgi:hypothetical protein
MPRDQSQALNAPVSKQAMTSVPVGFQRLNIVD